MTPAFGLVEAKGLLPYFAQSVAKVGCLPIPIEPYDHLLCAADR